MNTPAAPQGAFLLYMGAIAEASISVRRAVRAAVIALLFLSSGAQADVTATFYAREFGNYFPHAFFTVEGATTAGEKVEGSYGFTAKHVSPALLTGSVLGEIDHPKPKYVIGSIAHFRAVLSDDEYRALMAAVEKWRTRPQKSYNLNRANCVHFIADAARSIGMEAPDMDGLMKKPRSFLKAVAARNTAWLAARRSVAEPVATD